MSLKLILSFFILISSIITIFISTKNINLFSPAALIKETENTQITSTENEEIEKIIPGSQNFISEELEDNNSVEIISEQNQILTLSDIVEKLDDISEKVDILAQQTDELIKSSSGTSNQNSGISEINPEFQKDKLSDGEKTNQNNSASPSPTPTSSPFPENNLDEQISPAAQTNQSSFIAPPGGGDPVNTSLPLILISEIAVGWENSQNESFVIIKTQHSV